MHVYLFKCVKYLGVKSFKKFHSTHAVKLQKSVTVVLSGCIINRDKNPSCNYL